MNSDPPSHAERFADSDAENGGAYSLEVIAELAGVSPQTVIFYQESGWLRPVSSAATDGGSFDSECLRQLRRIEHLRSSCGMNEAGLELVLNLLEEVEFLRHERRRLLR